MKKRTRRGIPRADRFLVRVAIPRGRARVKSVAEAARLIERVYRQDEVDLPEEFRIDVRHPHDMLVFLPSPKSHFLPISRSFFYIVSHLCQTGYWQHIGPETVEQKNDS